MKRIFLISPLRAAQTNDGGEGPAAPATGENALTREMKEVFERSRVNDYAPGTDFTLADENQRGEKFQVDGTGVYSIRKKKDQNGEESDCAPVKISARVDVLGKTKNTDGEQWGRVISFRDGDGETHRLTVSMGEIYGGGMGLIQRLGAAGLMIYDVTAWGGLPPLNRYLNAFPLDDIPTIKTVDGGGWTDESFSCFVFDGESIRTDRGDVAELGANAPAPKIKARGTLANWQDWLKRISPYSCRVSFGVMVALAAPLLPVIGDSSRLFHFYGPSSTGKSTAAKVAATVWGTADEWVNSWDVTKRAPAALAKRYGGLPLIFDELKVAGDVVKDISYILASGKDRARCDRLGNAVIGRTWSLYVISSGEGSLAEIKRQTCKGKAADVATGELVRFLDIPAIADANRPQNGMFESLPDCALDANEEKAIVKRKAWIDGLTLKPPFYGVAGPAFLRALENDIEATGLTAFQTAALQRVNEFVSSFGSRSVATARVLMAFGIVALAGELAQSYGVLPWAPGDATKYARACFEAWRSAADTLEERGDNFVSAVQDDAKRCANSYRHYGADGRLSQSPTGNQASFGALLTRSTDEGAETLCAAYSAGEFVDLISRVGAGISRGEAMAFLKDKKRLISNKKDEHAGEYRAPVRKGVLPLGLSSGKHYKMILLTDDKEAVLRMLETLKLNPPTEI